MNDSKAIHIKLEYREALQSKADIITTKINLLRALRAVKKYNFTRIKELKLKTKLHAKIKETKREINKLKRILPEIKIPEILKKEEQETIGFTIPSEQEREEQKTQEIITGQEKAHNKNLENQLQDIQSKLRSLS